MDLAAPVEAGPPRGRCSDTSTRCCIRRDEHVERQGGPREGEAGSRGGRGWGSGAVGAYTPATPLRSGGPPPQGAGRLTVRHMSAGDETTWSFPRRSAVCRRTGRLLDGGGDGCGLGSTVARLLPHHRLFHPQYECTQVWAMPKPGTYDADLQPWQPDDGRRMMRVPGM